MKCPNCGYNGMHLVIFKDRESLLRRYEEFKDDGASVVWRNGFPSSINNRNEEVILRLKDFPERLRGIKVDKVTLVDCFMDEDLHIALSYMLCTLPNRTITYE